MSILCFDVTMNIRLCKIITEFLECSNQISNHFNRVSNDQLELSMYDVCG